MQNRAGRLTNNQTYSSSVVQLTGAAISFDFGAIHREAEKRNQFSFVSIFLVLDKNW